jgi:hypothetical protein
MAYDTPATALSRHQGVLEIIIAERIAAPPAPQRFATNQQRAQLKPPAGLGWSNHRGNIELRTVSDKLRATVLCPGLVDTALGINSAVEAGRVNALLADLV